MRLRFLKHYTNICLHICAIAEYNHQQERNFGYGGGSVERPTALLRRFLIVEALHGSMAKELASIKEQMRHEGLIIIDRRDNVHDVWIQYLHESQHDEAIFMRKMLEAESRNRAKRTGMMSP